MTIREAQTVYIMNPIVYVYHRLSGKKYYLGVLSECPQDYLDYEIKAIHPYQTGKYIILEIGI